MFSSEGSARSERQNRAVAGYLAFVGGFVNSSGFVLIGQFTSHVTGNVGRLADDVARLDLAAASTALLLVVSFFVGAVWASVVLESTFFAHRSRAYGSALATEAVLLLGFTLISYSTPDAHPLIREAEAALLCISMGMQNALVTRLSGAVVRTTHLTGVVTDLGIEVARWGRYFRSEVSRATGIRLLFGPGVATRPAIPKSALLIAIAWSFLFGAFAGAVSAVHFGHLSMLFAATTVAGCAAYAVIKGRAHRDNPTQSRR